MQRLTPLKTRRRKWLIIAGLSIAVIALAAMTLSLFLSRWARGWIVSSLSEHYDSQVELRNFHISLLPSVHVSGEGLVFRHKRRTDVPPLVTLESFEARANLLALLLPPRRFSQVVLRGLLIQVPPKQGADKSDDERNRPKQTKKSPIVLQTIVADGTTLKIISRKPDKEPLVFDIRKLTLQSVRTDGPMHFRAVLTNAKPPGLIHSEGEFGPWYAPDPGETPISGNYTFRNANLGVFKGISGTLASDGAYRGQLGRLDVKGWTDVPDFAVSAGNHPVHLKTDFHAVVDGTNGDTLLEPVNATFLNSSVLARGGVTNKPGTKGKTVTLDVTVSQGRVEDMLRLAVKSEKPILTGAISFTTKFELPPGEEDVIDKLALDGRFGIDAAKFTEFKLQEKVNALSRSGRGEPENENVENVVSNLKGHFVMNTGTIRFSDLSFAVPGASVRISGTYGLRTEALNFHGTVRLQAKVSEATTGVKSFFLKLVDPLFKKKNAGAVIPIKIGGTREKPSFGIDVGRTLNGQ